MKAFKNIKTNSIRVFGNISDTPRLYAETIAKTSANKELKPEEIEWELIENYEPPKEPEIDPKEQKIAELKAKLAKTDYQAIKHSEGRMTEEEYAPISEQRQVWRDAINELESQL